ncbi:MAG: hypothetical protein JNM56_16545 [Planctomycetia bacterium]|nr:hypothetical protein [Planctomycetia bacterium]
MVPPIIHQKLSGLRSRERWLRFAWGLSRRLAIVVGVLIACCLADWIIDRYQDTPFQLRQMMLYGQVFLWAVLAVYLVAVTFIRSKRDDELALYVEEQVPSLGHRLISTLQLNRPDAKTQGMSPVLIGQLTKETEGQIAGLNFASLADHRRLNWALQLGLVVVLLAGGIFLFARETAAILLARQFLADREIPRSVELKSDNATAYYPSGEEVVLNFRVKKRSGVDLKRGVDGWLSVYPDDAPRESYPLVYIEPLSTTEARYQAKVKATTVSFNYRAGLRDGRTRQLARANMEPRPSVIRQDAWVQLPRYSGLRPDGQPYELGMPRGDVVGLEKSLARVVIGTQKPVVKATLELLHVAAPAGDAGEGDADADKAKLAKPAEEKLLRPIDMKLAADGLSAEGYFDLRPDENLYRSVVHDQHGFLNLDPPRRTIRIAPQEPPLVALLPERLPVAGKDVTEDDEIEGVPILEDQPFRVAYVASSPYGLGRAVLRYRINDGDWFPLPLREAKSTEATGPFNPKSGAFVNSDVDPQLRGSIGQQVEFHRMPSPDVLRMPPGTDGGGRLDFKTAGLMKLGDKIEFYIEVYDRNPDDVREPGRSETRQKTVVNKEQYFAWQNQVIQQESRIRQLEARQRTVFASATNPEENPKNPNDPTTKPEPPPVVHSFLRSWQIIGPFPNPAGKGFTTPYPPEDELIDLRKDYDGVKGKVRWKVQRSPTDKIDLEKILSHSKAGVAYAVCWFRCDDARGTLLTGSDDGIKVWINRKEVLARKALREAVPGEDKTPVEFKADEWNELLVKVDNRTSTWAFFLELQTTDGKALEGLKVRTLPPGEEDTQFVRNWQLIGPFANNGEAGRDHAFAVEKDKVDLDKEYDGIGGKVRWKLLESESETGRIGLDRFFERPFNEANLAYAVCWVKCDKEREAVLATGSDDGIKVWINRKLKIDANVSRDAEPGKDIQKATLNAGWNEILVKVDNRFGRWAFFFELRDPETERPLEGVEFSTKPPKD